MSERVELPRDEGERPDRCGTCRWWGGWPDDDAGLCRRYPPAFGAREMEPGEVEAGHLAADRGFWPVTDSDDWCGEWRPREGDKQTAPRALTTEEWRAWFGEGRLRIKEVIRATVRQFPWPRGGGCGRGLLMGRVESAMFDMAVPIWKNPPPVEESLAVIGRTDVLAVVRSLACRPGTKTAAYRDAVLAAGPPPSVAPPAGPPTDSTK
jgi:hypothetical protein